MITLHFAQLFSKNNAALTSDPEAAHLMLSPSAHVHRLTHSLRAHVHGSPEALTN